MFLVMRYSLLFLADRVTGRRGRSRWFFGRKHTSPESVIFLGRQSYRSLSSVPCHLRGRLAILLMNRSSVIWPCPTRPRRSWLLAFFDTVAPPIHLLARITSSSIQVEKRMNLFPRYRPTGAGRLAGSRSDRSCGRGCGRGVREHRAIS